MPGILFTARDTNKILSGPCLKEFTDLYIHTYTGMSFMTLHDQIEFVTFLTVMVILQNVHIFMCTHPFYSHLLS